MLIVGLTGGSGTGKGEVSKLFVQNGFYHFDTDLDARAVTEKGTPCLKEIEKHFEGVMNADGTLNRKALGKIVFNDEKKLLLLNSIIHQYITIRIKEKLNELEKNGTKKAIIDGAALFESGINGLCTCVIAVISQKEKRIERIMKRDNLTKEEAATRINGQKADSFYIDNADFVIENNDNVSMLSQKVDIIITNIIKEYR